MRPAFLFTIRVCVGTDLPILEEFCQKLYTEQAYDRPPESVVGRLSEYSLLAEVGGRPVGFILAVCETIEFMKSELGRDAFPGETNYLEIQEFYVLPDFRGNGIGTSLVQRVIEKARQNGILRSMVYSGNADYIRTARFYEKCGFKMWQILMTQ